MKILWEHPIIIDFKPSVKKIKFLDEKENEKNIEKEENVLLKDQKIEVSQMFKPNQNIKPIFNKYSSSTDNSFYTLKECADILVKYLKSHELFVQGTNEIRLNEELQNLLFKKEKVQKISFNDLQLKWKKNLNEKDFITKTDLLNDESEIIQMKGNVSLKVKIISRKINGKNVTFLTGLENFVNVKDAIKIFSKHFACSVCIKDFNGIKDAICIQGYWVSELKEILTNEIKLNKQFLEVEDKLNLKKKK